MKISIRNLQGLFLVLILTQSGSLSAAHHEKDLIAQAMSAAPSSISAEATIMDGGKVLREGSNGWVCMPHTMPGDNAPMCNDAVWMKMMQAVGSQSDFQTDRIGISYMLQGDYGAGVSNATPYHPVALRPSTPIDILSPPGMGRASYPFSSRALMTAPIWSSPASRRMTINMTRSPFFIETR